jgi:hypothetical protein
VDDRRNPERRRRESDRELDYIIYRLRHLENRLEKEVDHAEVLHRAFDTELDRLRDCIDQRIRELETYRIEETTEARLKIVARTQELEGGQRRQVWISITIAAVSSAVAIIEHFHLV